MLLIKVNNDINNIPSTFLLFDGDNFICVSRTDLIEEGLTWGQDMWTGLNVLSNSEIIINPKVVIQNSEKFKNKLKLENVIYTTRAFESIVNNWMLTKKYNEINDVAAQFYLERKNYGFNAILIVETRDIIDTQINDITGFLKLYKHQYYKYIPTYIRKYWDRLDGRYCELMPNIEIDDTFNKFGDYISTLKLNYKFSEVGKLNTHFDSTSGVGFKSFLTARQLIAVRKSIGTT